MFKVVVIGGKKIPMKSSGRTGRIYSRKFGRDILTDFIKISSNTADNTGEVLEDLAWTFAKTANENIPEIEEWLEQFAGMFDVLGAYTDIMELMGDSFKSNVNSKKNKLEKKKKQ